MGNAIKGIFGGGAPKPPKPPKPKAPAPMPVPDDDAIRQAQLQKIAQQQALSGRASTILSDTGASDKLG